VLHEYARQQRLTEQNIQSVKNRPAAIPVSTAAMPPEKAAAIADQSVSLQ
jgi:hypothetical protein